MGDRRELDMGEGMSEWKEVSLGSICEIYDGPHATPPKQESGFVFLGISSLGLDGRIDPSAFEYVSEEFYKKWTKRVTPLPEDIVFSYETKLGVAALIPRDLKCCLGRRMGLMRVKSGILPRFLLYSYLAPEFQKMIYERTTHGSTVDRIALRDLPNFPIHIPSINTQQKIASILSSLDDKIDLLHRQNKTLEAIAETLFRQWFIEEAQDDWEDDNISQLISIQNGYAFKSKDFKELGQNGVLKIKNISEGIIDINNTDFIDTELAINTSERFKVNTGDVLIGMTGAEIGKLGIVPKTNKPLWLNQRVGLLKEKFKGCRFLAYIQLKSEFGQDFIENSATGSAQPNISGLNIEYCSFPKLDTSMIEKCSIEISPLYEKLVFNLGQIQTLEKLRDNLLPKLMSGEVRVET